MTLEAQRTLLASALAQCDTRTPVQTRNERKNALLAFDKEHPEVLHHANHAICRTSSLRCPACSQQKQSVG